MPGYFRAWLAPLCLVLAIVAVWAFSGEPECPDSPWDGSPAIARVGDDCVYALQLNTYIRDLSLGLGPSDQGSGVDGSGLGEFLLERQRLESEFGLANAAFAALAQDVALYQLAVADGQSAPDGEVMAVMGANRDRISGLGTLLELHELARESDLEGFRDLIVRPEVMQLIPVQGEEHLLALFEQAANIDLSGAARGMEIHEGLLESVGDDLYWTEVFFELARWLVTIESFRVAMDPAESALTPDLQWQDIREKTWGSTVIGLTDAAPEGVSPTEVGLYMNELHALERAFLTR